MRYTMAALSAGLVLLLATACGETSVRGGDTVRVSGRTFRMGIDTAEIPGLRERYGVRFRGSFETEAPSREVTVSGFRMDRHEVTNRQFAAFVDERPEWGWGRLSAEAHNGDYLKHWVGGACPDALLDHPVTYVTWHAALSCCRWMGGRLPTESEWEAAARAGDDREFPWGAEMPSSRRANYAATGLGRTAPVGSYGPNPLRLCDMSGNVWEWTLDEWMS